MTTFVQCEQCQARGTTQGLLFTVKKADGVVTCVNCQLHGRCDYDVTITHGDEDDVTE